MGQFIQTREVIGQDVHRVPPRWRRMRSAGGKIVRELVPASTKLVNVRRMVHVDRSIYTGNVLQEIARRQATGDKKFSGRKFALKARGWSWRKQLGLADG